MLPPRPIAAEAAAFAKKTPANGTISLNDGLTRLPDHQLRVRHREHQASSTTAKNIRSVLEWAINPKDGNSTQYLSQVNFQPLPAKVEAGSLKQIRRSSRR